jgi:rubrerythrin
MDRISTIQFAIQNEAKETAYYLAEAERSKNPVARTLFKNLAKDEQEHVTKIKVLHAELVANGKWPEDVPIQVADTDVMAALDQIGDNHASTAVHDDDDIRALQRAVEVEKEGRALYVKLAGSAASEAERNFFEFLARIEDQHLKSVLDSLAYLQDPEGWYVSQGCGC